MSSTFIGLPVPSGEAFLLKTQAAGRTWTILVDSGHRSQGDPHPLVDAIRSMEPGLRRIDVAVCTHQDADHANGFLTFADHWCGDGGEIDEIWLPGRWASSFPDILTNPAEYQERVVRGAIALGDIYLKEYYSGRENQIEQNEQLVMFEDRFRNLGKKIDDYDDTVECQIDEAKFALGLNGERETYSESRSNSIANAIGVSNNVLRYIKNACEDEDDNETLDQKVFDYNPHNLFLFHGLFNDELYNVVQHSIFSSAIEAVKKIRRIAVSAIRNDIRIRWFDFGLFETGAPPKGGIQDILEPINSVEIFRPPKVGVGRLVYNLTLSRQNVESLVFLRPGSLSEPAVVFTGDSRLSFGVNQPTSAFSPPAKKPDRPALVTAPHHGSRVNDKAYSVLTSWLGSKNMQRSVFVRNGGSKRQTMESFFQRENRFCVMCRSRKSMAEITGVRVTSENGEWLSDCNVRKCQCGYDGTRL